jgi:hypothetical protein
MIDRDLRSAANRAAHAVGLAEGARARQSLQDALQRLRAAGATRASQIEYLSRCEAAGCVLPEPTIITERSPA